MVDAQCRLLLAQLSSALENGLETGTGIGFLGLGLQEDCCRTAGLRIAGWNQQAASRRPPFSFFYFVGLFGAIDLIDPGAQSLARTHAMNGLESVVWRANAGGRRRTQTARLRCCNAVMQCSTVQLQCVAGGQKSKAGQGEAYELGTVPNLAKAWGFFFGTATRERGRTDVEGPGTVKKAVAVFRATKDSLAALRREMQTGNTGALRFSLALLWDWRRERETDEALAGGGVVCVPTFKHTHHNQCLHLFLFALSTKLF